MTTIRQAIEALSDWTLTETEQEYLNQINDNIEEEYQKIADAKKEYSNVCEKEYRKVVPSYDNLESARVKRNAEIHKAKDCITSLNSRKRYYADVYRTLEREIEEAEEALQEAEKRLRRAEEMPHDSYDETVAREREMFEAKRSVHEAQTALQTAKDKYRNTERPFTEHVDALRGELVNETKEALKKEFQKVMSICEKAMDSHAKLDAIEAAEEETAGSVLLPNLFLRTSELVVIRDRIEEMLKRMQ